MIVVVKYDAKTTGQVSLGDVSSKIFFGFKSEAQALRWVQQEIPEKEWDHCEVLKAKQLRTVPAW